MADRSTYVLAAPFPSPSPVVVANLDELRLAAALPPESEQELRRLSTLPRPWDPTTCADELRCLIYVWLDEVVAWINEEHTWRTDHLIPMCWQEHPHIVHELATITCLRWEAAYAVTPNVLEDWHRYALPTFLDRISQRIGTTGCPPGRHQAHPGDARNAIYREGDEPTRRREHRWEDASDRREKRAP